MPTLERYLKYLEEIKNYEQLKPNKMKYEITEEQINEIYNGGGLILKEWFPEVFETKLEVEKWYRIKEYLFCFEGIRSKSFFGYGFDFKPYGKIECEYFDSCLITGEDNIGLAIQATEEEVFEALKNEVIKRYKIGDYIHRSFDKSLNDRIININTFPTDKTYNYNIECDFFELNGFVVYSKGQWASILKTYTKEEAEKMLNAKIV